MFPDYAYENTRRVRYGDAQFIPVCIKCGRYVKADSTILVDMEGRINGEPNATCSKCGRTEMIFEGYV